MINRSISMYDLMTYPEIKKAVLENDKSTFDKCLFFLGVDTSIPYEVKECLHRPLKKGDNEEWFGGLVVGTERVDSNWLKSGNASWECRIECTRDPEMRATLKQMSATGCADKTFTDENVAKRVVNQEKNKYKESL